MEPIEYQMTEEDLVRWNLFYAAGSGYHKRYLLIFRIFMAGAFVVLAILELLSRRLVPALLFFAVAVLWFAFAPGVYRFFLRRQVKKLAGETYQHLLQEPLTLAIEEDGIYCRTGVGDSVFQYRAIERVAEGDGTTYILIGKGIAIILPHDRIGKETVDAFVSEVERRREVPAWVETPKDRATAKGDRS